MNILNKSDITTGYIIDPLSGRSGDTIITFSNKNTSGAQAGDTFNEAMLLDSVEMGFSQPAARKFFLNTKKSAYIRGFGSGTLTVRGLLGTAAAFGKVFGADASGNGCQQLMDATLTTGSLNACKDDGTPDATKKGCKFTAQGIVPIGITITASVQDNGVVYYQANAGFSFTNLTMDEIK